MIAGFAGPDEPATPLVVVDKATLPGWLSQNPDHAAWLNAIRYGAEPGAFALIPGGSAGLSCVLASPNAGEPVWAMAGLPSLLPEGAYALSPSLVLADSEAAVLGWALGAYTFARYKMPKRQPARLRWPDGVDHARVEQLARAVCLARDLISAPAEDMGPDELLAAGENVAHAGGLRARVIRGDDLLRENYPCLHIVGRASPRAWLA